MFGDEAELEAEPLRSMAKANMWRHLNKVYSAGHDKRGWRLLLGEFYHRGVVDEALLKEMADERVLDSPSLSKERIERLIVSLYYSESDGMPILCFLA